MKILAIVVTYYPDINLLEKNVSAFVDYVDCVLIWENTDKLSSARYRCFSNPKVKYVGRGENVGISKALNYAWKYAKENSYDYLLTMDQDSVFEDFKYYLDTTIYNANAPQGIYGPTVKGQEPTCKFSQQNLITSGLLIKTDYLNQIGGFNEDFKIDGIDHWFCFSANELGVPTYCVSECYLDQCYGTPTCIKVFGFTICEFSDYSASRLYGIYYSTVAVLRRFKVPFTFKYGVWRDLFFKRPIRILLFEKNKCDKIMSMARGVINGLKD